MDYLKFNDLTNEYGEKFEGYKFKRLSSKAVLAENQDNVYIIYINTIVFKYNAKTKKIVLNSDGWFTNTTKKWINYGFNYVNADYYNLYQKAFKWYIYNCNDEYRKLMKKDKEYKDYIELTCY